MKTENIGVSIYNAVLSGGKNKTETSENSNKNASVINDPADSGKVTSEKKTDTIELSKEAQKIIEKKNKEAQAIREAFINKQIAEDNMKAAKQQSDAMEKETKNQFAMLKIMQRIAHGDKVPAKDEKALMEYDSEMYQMAKLTAMIRKNHKPHKYDSALEDEETETTEEIESSDECETVSTETETEASPSNSETE